MYLTFRCCVENLLHTVSDWQVERQAIALRNKFVTPLQKQYFYNDKKYIKRRSNNRNITIPTPIENTDREKKVQRGSNGQCSLWNVFEVKFSFIILFFRFVCFSLVRLSLYIRKSAGAVGVLFYRLRLCAGGVVVPHTFTCPPISKSFGRVAVEALPTIVTKSPGRVVFATEANSSTLLARE